MSDGASSVRDGGSVGGGGTSADMSVKEGGAGSRVDGSWSDTTEAVVEFLGDVGCSSLAKSEEARIMRMSAKR